MVELNAAGQPRTPVRCAIYTRKSTDEGLDQAFNSLDAQREACEAYIASQRHEGWQCLSEFYDDGGYSGGSMDRPALKRMMSDVAAGRVDVIVIYKIDRLTRSLSDFARIVEVLDRAEASFVSVTQAFSTTTSMGRLTLNVLLSFAQFEREVGAERVRDKIAASKKKGMWMGGVCPIGFDVGDRALVVNEPEAETVRLIFERYLELGSVLALEAELRGRGIVSKRRIDRAGKQTGGKPFSRGALYLLLKNVLYIGRVPHRGESYVGQHQAIVDDELFERAQRLLCANRVSRRADHSAHADAPLLAGRVWDEHGRRMSPSHSTKGARRYRYYVSRSDAAGASAVPIVRVPAGELESLVMARLHAFLMDSRAVHDVLEKALLPAAELENALTKASASCDELDCASAAQRKRAFEEFVISVTVASGEIRIVVDVAGLVSAGCQSNGMGEYNCLLEVSARLARRTREVRLIVPADRAQRELRDPGLIKLLVRAREVRKAFEGARGRCLKELAAQLDYHLDYFTVLLKLSFLAPALTAAILEGKQPEELTRQRLARIRDLPCGWSEQRESLGLN